MKIERGMPPKKTERQKLYKTVSGKMAYIVTLGYIEILRDFKEFKASHKLQSWLKDIPEKDATDYRFDAHIKFEEGKALFCFWPWDKNAYELEVKQWKSNDLAKSMLLFINLVFPFIFEDYKLLELAEERSKTMITRRTKEKEETAREISQAPPKLSTNRIEYHQLSDTEYNVLLNNVVIGQILYAGMNKKRGWHTIVPKCRDKYKTRLYATYNSIEAAKTRIESEYLTQ